MIQRLKEKLLKKHAISVLQKHNELIKHVYKLEMYLFDKEGKDDIILFGDKLNKQEEIKQFENYCKSWAAQSKFFEKEINEMKKPIEQKTTETLWRK